jgi:hypothetical protein|tara:strand:+ start:228 stop:485 length:258 start_codon:yes stop_codon:yes gene_type:complete
MAIDTTKQASMYVKGYMQNIWKRDESGQVVKPFEKTGEQFKVIQTINMPIDTVRPGESITVETLNQLVERNNVDVSMVEAPRPKN